MARGSSLSIIHVAQVDGPAGFARAAPWTNCWGRVGGDEDVAGGTCVRLPWPHRGMGLDAPLSTGRRDRERPGRAGDSVCAWRGGRRAVVVEAAEAGTTDRVTTNPASCSWKSNPLMPGSRTSTTMQPGTSRRSRQLLSAQNYGSAQQSGGQTVASRAHEVSYGSWLRENADVLRRRRIAFSSVRCSFLLRVLSGPLVDAGHCDCHRRS